LNHTGVYSDPTSQIEIQTVIEHLLTKSPLWKQVTAGVRGLCGDSFGDLSINLPETEEGWKRDLWENSLVMLGGQGMEMIAQVWADWEGDVKETYKGVGWQKLRRYSSVIASLKTQPKKVKIGFRWTYELPHMARI
jgi:hypothetical protein